MNTHPRVSVIMRTKNSAWVVEQALAGLFAQDYRDFELLVIDSGSTDETLEIVRRYPARIIEISADEYFPGAVLNMGIEHCRSELVVFQNSDVVPLSPKALSALVGAFDSADVVAAFGRQQPRPEAEPWVCRDYRISFPERGDTPPWIELSLPFAAMRRSAWQQHRFYSDAWASEDTEWGHWARSQGLQVRYVPEARVMHSHNYTLRQLYGRRFVEGEADAFIYRDRHSLAKLLTRWARSSLADLKHHLASAELAEIPVIPVRRAVYHWAHYRGHRLGERRQATGDSDTRTGQQIVLARYEATS